MSEALTYRDRFINQSLVYLAYTTKCVGRMAQSSVVSTARICFLLPRQALPTELGGLGSPLSWLRPGGDPFFTLTNLELACQRGASEDELPMLGRQFPLEFLTTNRLKA